MDVRAKIRLGLRSIAPAPPPTTVTADAGKDQTICAGNSATLTASGGTSYKWSTGETTASITVNPTQTTTYSVEVSDGTSSDTDEVKVSITIYLLQKAGSDVTITKRVKALRLRQQEEILIYGVQERPRRVLR